MQLGLHADGKKEHKKILKKTYQSKIRNVMELFLIEKSVRKPSEHEAKQSEIHKDYEEKLKQTDYNLY